MDICKQYGQLFIKECPDAAELAEKYATRTVKLLDGNIIEDSDPFAGEETEELSKKEQRKRKKSERKRQSPLC